MIVENTGRKQVKGKFSVIVDDSVTSVAAALETNDNVGFLCQHICDLAFSLVAPVGAYDCSNHVLISSFGRSNGMHFAHPGVLRSCSCHIHDTFIVYNKSLHK